MSKWVEHIRDFAKRNNLTYGCALSDPKCSEEYRVKFPKPDKKRKKTSLEEETIEIIPVKRKKVKKKLDLSKTEFTPLEEAEMDTEPKTKMIVAKKPPKAPVNKIPVLTETAEARSKREYLKSPFNKFYIGEEVEIVGQGRAIIVRQTDTGVTLKPTDGGRTYRRINSSAQFVKKIIEGTGFLSLLTGKPHSVVDWKKLFERAYIILSDLSKNGSISSNADNLLNVINDERGAEVVKNIKKKEGKIAWYEKKIEDIRRAVTPDVFDRLFEPNPSKKDPTEILGRELPTVDRQSEFVNPVKQMGRGVKLTRDMVMEMVGKGLKG